MLLDVTLEIRCQPYSARASMEITNYQLCLNFTASLTSEHLARVHSKSTLFFILVQSVNKDKGRAPE